MKENLVIQVSKQHINVESVTFFIKKKARNFDCSKCIKMISGKPFPIARHKITINISAYDSP